MSPRRTRRGTIRDSVSVSEIADASSKSISKTLRSTRRLNKSQNVKGLEQDSENPVEASVLNDISVNTRKRKLKSQEISTYQDSSLSATVDESKNEKVAKKNERKSTKPKRQTKSNKSQTADTNSLISSDESFTTKNSNGNKQESDNVDNLISDDEDPVHRKRIKTNDQNSLSDKGELKALTNTVKVTEGTITPKTSPVNVSLTIHRSTKTPKKSPINIGSPKSHSRNSLKFLNVPKKLPITDSPPSSEASNNSLQQFNSSPVKNESEENRIKSFISSKEVLKLLSSKKKSISPALKSRPKFSKSPKIVFKSPKSKSNKKSTVKRVSLNSSVKNSPKTNVSSEVNLSSKSKKSLDTSDKMLKIILPAESLSSPTSDSPLKSKTSPTAKSPKNNSSSKSKNSSRASSSGKSPKFKKKSPKNVSPVKKETILLSISDGKSIDSDLSKNISLSPRVVVNKLPTQYLKNSSLVVKENQPSITLVPVDVTSQSKSSKLSSKNQSAIKLGTPAGSVKTRISTSKISNATSLSFKNTPSDVLERKLVHLKPANTSTPKQKTKRVLNLVLNKKDVASDASNNAIVLNGSLNSKSKVIKQLNNYSKTDHPLLEDESEPSMDNSSLMHMSEVFDSDDSQKNNTFEIDKGDSSKRQSVKDSNISQKDDKNHTFTKDNTYEVENPKTPGFQKKSNKRKLNEAELDTAEEQVTKKTCKVHFASPDSKVQIRPSSINRIGTPGHAIQQKKTVTLMNKSKTPVNQSLVNNVQRQKRMSLLSSSQKRQSNSLSDSNTKSRRSTYEAQVASANRLSKPRSIVNSEKKLEQKTPTARRIPNFAEIHKKNFAKMESLVDLKKRVEKRHIILNTATSSAKKTLPARYQSENKKLAPPNLTNEAYNRFGFKIRKDEAINIISKKQTNNVTLREKKKEEARNVLKGVRMNRRFELQMKARIKNQ